VVAPRRAALVVTMRSTKIGAAGTWLGLSEEEGGAKGRERFENCTARGAEDLERTFRVLLVSAEPREREPSGFRRPAGSGPECYDS
jgi:hypothetical protein